VTAPGDARSRRAAVSAIVISTLAIGGGYASAFVGGGAPPWGGWLFAAGVTGVLVATLALGALRRDATLGRLALPFALTAVMIGAGFVAVFALPDTGASEPLLFGLPRRAAIVLYGIGLFPTLVLPVAYALTFEAQTLREADLARLRAMTRATQAADEGAG